MISKTSLLAHAMPQHWKPNCGHANSRPVSVMAAPQLPYPLSHLATLTTATFLSTSLVACSSVTVPTFSSSASDP